MKTVLITGASRGLGQALMAQFVVEGYRLILNSKTNIDEMNTLGKRYDVKFVKGDLNNIKTISKLTELAKERDLDILINNAGIYQSKPFADLIASDIWEVLDINLVAPMLLTRSIWPIFQKKKSGLVININSLAGKTGADGETVYCASKFGLAGFSKALQFDAVRYGIRVIDVFIGGMKTDMTKDRKDSDKFIDIYDVASTIVNLCEELPTARITEIEICRRNY